MKKFILTFILSVLMIASVFAASVEIGNGTVVNNYIPFNGLYDYSWSHFILPGDAITTAIDITELEFSVGNSPINYTLDNQIIYMRLTEATTVTSDYTADPSADGYTEIYNGSVTWDGGGWQGVALTTPFAYDGTSNIEIIWEHRDGLYKSGYPTFNRTAATGASAYKFADNAFPMVNGIVYNYYPNTRISWLQEGEPEAPILASPVQGAFNVAIDTNLEWTVDEITDHSILYLADNEEFTDATVVNPAISPYSASLNSGTTYFWKVVAVGPTSIETTSSINSFTTEFLPITEFPYTEGFEGPWIGSPSAPLGWGQITVSGLKPWVSYSSSPHSGSKCAQGPWASGGGEHLLITPTFDFDAATTYRLKFWLKGSTNVSYTTDLHVQIASDYTDATSFTNELAHYSPGVNMPGSWEEQIIDLVGYSGNHAIAFRLYDENGMNLYIDDVLIEEVPEGSLISITPDAHDFGELFIGQEATKTFTIANSGAVAAEITGVTVPAGYTVETTENFPFDLAVESSFTVDVTFSPTNEAVYAGNLSVMETDPDNPEQISHDVALTGTGIVIPQGAVCSNPLPLTFPAVDISGHTSDYGDFYSQNWIEPPSNYLSGDEVVYQFTLDNTAALSGTITTTNNYIGAFILQEEPNEGNPAPVIIEKTSSSTTLNYNNEMLSAGTYFLIISSWAIPQSITYNINLTVDFVTAPSAATNPTPTNEATNIVRFGNLSWDATLFAEGYKVFFSEDETFTDITPEMVTTNSYAYSGDFATTYYWKVIPYNEFGEPTEEIEVWSFTTIPSPFPEANIVFDGVRSTGYMPMRAYYNYSMTQNIYYQSELNVEDSAITSISYLYNNNSAWSETIEIFMKHTTKETFSSTSDWEDSGFTHVYSGTMTVNTTDPIVTIVLDTPFIYNNIDNLMVMFFATDSDNASNSDEFYRYPVEGNRSLTKYSDTIDLYGNFPETIASGLLRAYLPVTGFTCEELSEEAQFVVNAESLTFTDQIMGMASDPQTLAISNLGLADLGIISTVLTGVNADQFVLIDENEYPAIVESGGNMSAQVIYAPNTDGDHTAEIQITDNQSRVVHTVQLTGNAIDTNIYELHIPFTLTFEDEEELFGWQINLTSTSTSAKAERYSSVSSAYNGSYSFRFYQSSSATTEAELVSPVVVPNMELYRIRFWAKKSNNSNTDPLVIGKYSADMTTFTEIENISLTTTYTEYTVEMVVPERANERFAFKYATSGAYNNIYIDDVKFEETPTAPVAELNVTEINFGSVRILEISSSQTVSITNVGPGTLTVSNVAITGVDAVDFAWEYDAEAPDLGLQTNETLDINVTFAPITEGVKEATLVITDDLGRNIRINSASKTSNNSRDENSVALTGVAFDPIIYSLPFFEGFEEHNVHDSETVNSWSQISEIGNTVWTINETHTDRNRTPRSGSFNATLRYSNTDWLIRPIQLVGGQSYDIELYARQDGTNSANASIGIYYGTEATVESMEGITEQTGLINGDYQLIAGTFTPVTSGLYNIGIKGVINGSPWYISIDDIAISESQPAQLDAPVNVTMTSTESGLVISWDPVEGANSYIIYATDRRDGDFEIIDTVSETSYSPDGVDRVKLFKIKASPESINSLTGFSRRGRD